MTYHSKIKLITAIDLLFLFLLCVSGSTDGTLGNLLYYSAFVFPILIGMYFLYSPYENKAKREKSFWTEIIFDISIGKKDLLTVLPLLFPSIAVIMILSFLTTLILNRFGFTNEVSFDEPFIVAVILHALIPAVLEEILFRFIPLKLLNDERKTAVILSSLMFAFAHASLFQIPYAFVAGSIFSLLYFSTGSILITISFHFLNNFISLLSIYGTPEKYIIISVAFLSVLSLGIIFIKRKDYINSLRDTFTGKKIKIAYEPLIFIAFSLFLAISALVF